MPEASFTLAINYWPRQRAGTPQIPSSWAVADQGAVCAELAHIAELGFTQVDLTLRWAEAQPGPARLGMSALTGLERALDAAHAVGLQASVTLLAGVFGGALHLPLWAVGHRMIDDLLRARRFGPVVVPTGVELPPILTDDRYRREPVGDLYGDADLRTATAYLINEVVGGLAEHPALAAWSLGNGMPRVRRPASAQEARRWWHDLAALALSRGARRVLAVVDRADLRRSASLRPTALVAERVAVGVSALPVPFQPNQRAWMPLDVRFLHAVVAALLQTELGRAIPVHVTDLGVPTAAEGQTGWIATEIFGRATTLFLADAEEQARFLESALAALHQDGAAGVTLAAYADQSPGSWSVPPLDRSWLGRTGGIVDAAGNPKPAAVAVRVFAERLRTGTLPTPGGPPAMPVDPERYWHTPEAVFDNLAQEFFDQA